MRTFIVKWLLIALNLLAAALGIAVIVIGGVAVSQLAPDKGFNAAAAIIIIAGILIVCLAIVGAVSTLKESSTLLLAYMIFMVVTISAVLGVSVASFAVIVWGSSSNATIAQVEAKYDCCGWNSVLESTSCPVAENTSPCKPVLIWELQKGFVGIGVAGTLLFLLLMITVILAGLLRHRKLISPDKVRFFS